ncbi:TIGR00730 family Rossman fold protein [Fulvivirga sp. RKSG066]|uniref:LOG family protein n=1 Tax=Fulvivirga aurantia TaxID=2529383 RepID=UPI0012BC5F2C|nr:TIGR00730 family Rossman fold protein [Fulvivirga aurantia]MTI22639.1 TIGR00730 family Rossman fold protein [Fulvivirga aurantia]
MKNICVFCGSSKGNRPEYEAAAHDLGKMMAERNQTLVYGGGNIGLMGIVADSVLKHGGDVIGVIPDFLMKREVGHLGLTQLHVVSSMHERKQKMAELADAFIAMPGGFGTLEELAEIVTWVQLELIKKPIALLNIEGYYTNLIAQLNTMTSGGFTSAKHRTILQDKSSPQEILDLFDTIHANGGAQNLERT